MSDIVSKRSVRTTARTLTTPYNYSAEDLELELEEDEEDQKEEEAEEDEDAEAFSIFHTIARHCSTHIMCGQRLIGPSTSQTSSWKIPQKHVGAPTAKRLHPQKRPANKVVAIGNMSARGQNDVAKTTSPKRRRQKNVAKTTSLHVGRCNNVANTRCVYLV